MSRAYAEAKAKKPNAKKDTILKDISPVYEPNHGRTKQSFKDQTDINKILEKANRTGVVSHLAKHQGEYGDFSDIDDLLTAYTRMERVNEIFADLPGEIRREFNQSPADFIRWANDPANAEDLGNKLKAMAPTGDQRVPDVVRTAANQAASAPESASTAPSEPTPESGIDAGSDA